MLNPTKAQETLESLKVEDAEKRRLERITGLPTALRAIGFGVVGRNEDGKEDNTVRWWERRRAAGKWLGVRHRLLLLVGRAAADRALALGPARWLTKGARRLA